MKKIKQHNLEAISMIDKKISKLIQEYKHITSMVGVNKWRYG